MHSTRSTKSAKGSARSTSSSTRAFSRSPGRSGRSTKSAKGSARSTTSSTRAFSRSPGRSNVSGRFNRSARSGRSTKSTKGSARSGRSSRSRGSRATVSKPLKSTRLLRARIASRKSSRRQTVRRFRTTSGQKVKVVVDISGGGADYSGLSDSDLSDQINTLSDQVKLAQQNWDSVKAQYALPAARAQTIAAGQLITLTHNIDALGPLLKEQLTRNLKPLNYSDFTLKRQFNGAYNDAMAAYGIQSKAALSDLDALKGTYAITAQPIQAGINAANRAGRALSSFANSAGAAGAYAVGATGAAAAAAAKAASDAAAAAAKAVTDSATAAARAAKDTYSSVCADITDDNYNNRVKAVEIKNCKNPDACMPNELQAAMDNQRNNTFLNKHSAAKNRTVNLYLRIAQERALARQKQGSSYQDPAAGASGISAETDSDSD